MRIQKEIENVERIENRQPVEPLTMEDAIEFHKQVVDRIEKERKEINKELGLDDDIEEKGFTGASKEPKKVSTPELKKMKLSESLFEEVDRDTLIIETGLHDDISLEIMDSVIGQLSDGIWENSPRMEKYWKNIDISPNGEIIIKNLYPYVFETEEAARKWFAGKLKQIVKTWAKDYEQSPQYFKDVEDTSWDRNNDTPCSYLGYEEKPTVADAYRVYDILLSRKNRMSEKLTEAINGKRVIQISMDVLIDEDESAEDVMKKLEGLDIDILGYDSEWDMTDEYVKLGWFDESLYEDVNEINMDELFDIAERYNTSIPVSGSWDTELEHEQKEIADHFNISMEDAKQVMIDLLGFDESLYEDWDDLIDEIEQEEKDKQNTDAIQYDIDQKEKEAEREKEEAEREKERAEKEAEREKEKAEKEAERKERELEKAWEEKDWIAERELAKEKGRELDFSNYSDEERKAIEKKLKAYDENPTAQKQRARRLAAEKQKKEEEKKKQRKERLNKSFSKAAKTPGALADAVKSGLSKSGIHI